MERIRDIDFGYVTNVTFKAKIYGEILRMF